MSKTLKIYFAHPHAEKDSLIKKIILKVIKIGNNEVIDPFLKEEEKTGDGWLIWCKDLRLIDQCDIVFAWIPNREVIGIIAELEYAKKDKKIIIFTAIRSAFFEYLEKEFGADVVYY